MTTTNTIGISLLIFISLVITACEKTVTTQPFRSNAGRFSLMVSEPLTKAIKTVNTDAGPLSFTIFTINKPTISYLVSYVDYPDGVINPSDLDTHLENARKAMLEDIDGKLISEERIAYGKDPAIEIHYTAKDAIGLGHSVILLSGNRLYQVGAIGYKESFPKDVVQKYIDSFEIW